MVLWTARQAEGVAGTGAPAGGHAGFREVLGPQGVPRERRGLRVLLERVWNVRLRSEAFPLWVCPRCCPPGQRSLFEP